MSSRTRPLLKRILRELLDQAEGKSPDPRGSEHVYKLVADLERFIAQGQSEWAIGTYREPDELELVQEAAEYLLREDEGPTVPLVVLYERVLELAPAHHTYAPAWPTFVDAVREAFVLEGKDVDMAVVHLDRYPDSEGG